MYKLLLADDTKLTLAAEKSFFEARNLKVFATTSATEAQTLAEVAQPDLIILDYEMEEMTGDEVCRKLRANEQTAHIPVLILSSHDRAEIKEKCAQAGAAGFVRKTEGREALLEHVARVLGVPRRRHVRVGCRFTVGIVDGGKSFDGAVENISESGMFLTADKRFAVGMALRMAFSLPDLATEVVVLGEVVRTEELTGQAHGHGIQFLEINPGSRDILRQFLEKSI
jgi:CheY-like chemotaxis protein/Tfp pilus assembly protein PilZ